MLQVPLDVKKHLYICLRLELSSVVAMFSVFCSMICIFINAYLVCVYTYIDT